MLVNDARPRSAPDNTMLCQKQEWHHEGGTGMDQSGQQAGSGAREELEHAVLSVIDTDEVVSFHRGLVRIPSINPPGDCREAIAYVEQPLVDAGFATEIVSKDQTKPNLIARYG